MDTGYTNPPHSRIKAYHDKVQTSQLSGHYVFIAANEHVGTLY